MNGIDVEKVNLAYDRLWGCAPDVDRDSIEKGVLGRLVIGIYPLYDIRPDLARTVTGFSLQLWDVETHKVTTLDIEQGSDAAAAIGLSDGFIVPEEVGTCGANYPTDGVIFRGKGGFTL